MKRIVTLAIGIAILAVIYWRVDFGAVIGALTGADPVWMAVAFGLFIPLIWLGGVRLCRLAPQAVPLSLSEAIRLNLAAAVLNMVLPSKMGDLAKSWFFRQRGHMSGSLALALVVFERTCDMLSLLVWCVVGLAFVPSKDLVVASLGLVVLVGMVAGILVLSVRRLAYLAFDLLESVAPARFQEKVAGLRDGWTAMHDYFWADKRRLLSIAAFSVGIWFVNLLQIWAFAKSLHADIPVLDTLGLAPLAILVGLLPLTFAGVGTRDAAVIFFFRDYFSPETAAALGLLFTLRYVLMGLAGLPFISEVSTEAKRGR